MIDEAIAEDFNDLENDLSAQLENIVKDLEILELKAMLSGVHDDKNAILSVQAGAGGVDSQDWAEILTKMYSKWSESKGFKAKILNWTDGDEAGIKRADIEIIGTNAYGYLKGEAGVHRLIRISPFDQQHQRHTSFSLVEILPEVDNNLDIAIDPDELRMDYFRSSGAGGQSVQKNATAVRIVHEPSGITVSVQNERSQTRNREVAMKILTARLMERELKKQKEEETKLKGDFVSPEFGNQIRTYVMHPYKLVKDHRTNHESSDPDSVLAGDLDSFLLSYLQKSVGAS
jgi:peptide chain release factor 2